MRSRERLIEVLESVNGPVVGFDDRTAVFWMHRWLKYPAMKWAGDPTPHFQSYIDRQVGSTHIAELLSEGLAILHAQKIVGGTVIDEGPFKGMTENDGLAGFQEVGTMTDEQIKHMVDRFLAWDLPNDFRPDGGISFEQPMNRALGKPYPGPVGTNLLTAAQAEEMVRHMVEGLPAP
jgi:hypothetical protein